MSQYKSFETERLILRPTTEDDAPFILEVLNTPSWLKYIGDRNVKSVEDARKYICDRMLPQLKRLGYSNYTVIRKTDNTKMGVCGLYDRDGLEGIDIGFAFIPEYEGKGYAFEAAKEVKRVGTEEFGITHISAITSKENVASQRLLEKLGLRFIKLVKLPHDSEKIMLYA